MVKYVYLDLGLVQKPISPKNKIYTSKLKAKDKLKVSFFCNF